MGLTKAGAVPQSPCAGLRGIPAPTICVGAGQVPGCPQAQSTPPSAASSGVRASSVQANGEWEVGR